MAVIRPIALTATGGVAAGIAAAFLCGGMTRLALVLTAAGIILGTLLMYAVFIRIGRTPAGAFRVASWHWLWVAIVFFGLGVGSVAIQRPDDLPECKSAAVIGEVLEIRPTTLGDRLLVDVGSIVFPDGRSQNFSRLKVVVRSDAVTLQPGDIVAFRSDLQPAADNPNFISSGFAETMRRKGIAGVQDLPGEQFRLIGHRRSIPAVASRWRDSLEIFIENSGLARSTSDFLITLLLADKDWLDAGTRRLFSDAGVAHIVAVSGMHVAVIATIAFLLLFPLNFLGKYKWRYALTIPIVWAFVIFTGMGYSAVRAAVMLSFAFCGVILERKNSSMTALFWAAFFILLFSPLSMFDIGFQLSFLSVAALIAFAEPFNPIDHRRHPRLYKFVGALVAAFVATLASWMLSAYYFGGLPLMFLPANLLALPLLPLYVGLALAHLVLTGVFGASPSFIVWLLNRLYSGFSSFASFVTSGGDSTLTLDVGGWSVVLWTAGLILLAVAVGSRRSRRVKFVSAQLLLALSIVSIPFLAEEKEEEGVIVCNSYHEVKLHSYSFRELSELELPRKTLSVVNCNGHKIAGIDIALNDMKRFPSQADIVILCSGFKGSIGSLDSLLGIGNRSPRRLYVLHNSMRKKHEAEVRHEADSLGLRVHSLRYDGPWRDMHGDGRVLHRRRAGN